MLRKIRDYNTLLARVMTRLSGLMSCQQAIGRPDLRFEMGYKNVPAKGNYSLTHLNRNTCGASSIFKLSDGSASYPISYSESSGTMDNCRVDAWLP
jgi:hypothetical protein